MSKRILFASLFHETHTFLEGTTGLRDFTLACGDELLNFMGDISPIGGALAYAREQGWEIIPAVDMRAAPSAMVEDEVVETFWRELGTHLSLPLDGVYLALHGAMVSQSFLDVEGEILARLRKVIGPDIPVFGVFDLHANYTERMARHANCLVAYRENPHTDARQAGLIAAGLLQRSLTSGKTPRTYWHHPPIMWPPTGTATANDPMRSLEVRARAIEAQTPEIWSVSISAGFSFADTPDTGVSFAISTIGSEESARAVLHDLATLAMKQAEAGNVLDPPIRDVLTKLRPLPPGLTVLVEPSDNIGGGAPGDGTGVLRLMVEEDFPNAAIAINDPPAVQALASVHPGTKATLPIGGRGSQLDAGPLTLEVELLRRGDGRFTLEDKQSHLAALCGDSFDMGPCAVVRHRGLTILLTSNKTLPFDLGQWRSQGIEPTKLSVIAVKAAVAHRRVYDPIAARMLWVNTPGPCMSNLEGLPFRHLRRPIFPLDPLSSLSTPQHA